MKINQKGSSCSNKLKCKCNLVLKAFSTTDCDLRVVSWAEKIRLLYDSDSQIKGALSLGQAWYSPRSSCLQKGLLIPEGKVAAGVTAQFLSYHSNSPGRSPSAGTKAPTMKDVFSLPYSQRHTINSLSLSCHPVFTVFFPLWSVQSVTLPLL